MIQYLKFRRTLLYFNQVTKYEVFCYCRPQGGKDCQGPPTKYTTCNAQQCFNVPRITIKEFADQMCNRARDVEKDFTGTGMQKISSDRK